MLKLNKKVYEGKTKEEVLNRIETELNTSISNLYIEEKIINGGLFKGTKYILEVLTKDDIKEYIENYIQEYSKYMNIKIQCELKEEEGIYKLLLISDNNAILIGKEGKTLEYFQILLRQALLKNTGHIIKVNVDISGYKDQKIKKLESQIHKLAKEILNTKIDVSLDPMNSYERRIVHSIISKMENLKTESIGEGKERHIIIKYVEN
jgi:spoIIIJ-associated protein